jgi:hypothetical protein
MFHPRNVRLTVRSTVIVAVAAAVMGLVASAALAGSPHGVHAVTVTQSGNTLTAVGKEAGLGGELQVHIVLNATAECINGGGNHPKATNKTSVSAGDDFPVQNGAAEFSLTATATFKPDCSPPQTVRFSNVSVVDETNGITLYP